MKKILFFLFIFLFFMVPQQTYSHVNGQPVLKVNGVYTKISSTQNPKFGDTEQVDLAPQKYNVKQLLSFDLETSKFPTPKSVFDKTNFIWDYGDGTPKETSKGSSKNSHSYEKEGKFTLTITADYSEAGFKEISPQILQTVAITIGQDKNNFITIVILVFSILAVVTPFVLLTLPTIKRMRQTSRR